MRLIDADRLLGHLKPYEPSDEEWSVTGGTALRLIHRAVDNAPTVDAVVITRCKGCKHHYDCGVHFCNRLGMDCPDDSDFFCSYGEPKEGTHANDHD